MSGDIVISTATARLALTRERLRLAMKPPAQASKPAHSLIDAAHLKDLPIIGTVVEALQAWWFNHPMRPVASVAVEASNAVVEPLARRNPFVLVAGAAALGALFVWSRPWRWLFGPALFAGLVPQVASRVVSNLPIESWMTMLSTALAQTPRGARAQPPVSEPAATAADAY
jgi:hypothetical protein